MDDDWENTGGFSPTPLKKYESVGIMKFPIYGKIKAMFQTTNQLISGGYPPNSHDVILKWYLPN